MADINGDGDPDLLVGEIGGTLRYYENTGTANAPAYVARTGTANPFDGATGGNNATPTFADIDGDGDPDLVVGDSLGTIRVFTNASSGAGGADVILVGDGANIVVGGFGNDVITTGSGADIILGDNGAVAYTPGTTNLLQAVSTGVVGGASGNDTIVAGEGDNLVIAGIGADTVTTGSGVDRVIGDNGQINWTATGVLAQVRTTDAGLGGNDNLQVGDGANIVAGGAGSDIINTGVGEDLILGDNGVFSYTTGAGNAAVLTGARTTDTSPTTGGNDVIQSGRGSTASFADVNGDGKLDLVVGTSDGSILYFENTGNNALPVYAERGGAANPFAAIDVGSMSAPVLADINGDGLLDVIVGSSDGTVRTFANTGIAGAPVYTELVGVANPFNGIDVGSMSAPALVDLNGNGTLDMVIGSADGGLRTFDNTGTALVPVFTELLNAANPFNSINTGSMSTPAFVDLNGNGTFDLVLGSSDGTIRTFSNTGTTSVPVFTELLNAANPFNGFDVGNRSVPAVADLNGDGLADLVVGANGGALNYFMNTGTTSAPVFVERAGPANPLTDLNTGTGSARNVVLAGVGNDQVIDSNPGQDVVMGDNGFVTWDSTGVLTGFGSSQIVIGGNDVIDVGNGANIAVGGFGNDIITAGTGADIILGDNGTVSYTPNSPNLAQVVSTDTTNATGGNDTVAAGAGNNLVIGGVGVDTIIAGSGNDLLIGDNGQITWTPGGVLSSVGTTDPALGAGDTIIAGDGNNVVAGGFGSDVLVTGTGADLILGDNGVFTYTTGAGGTAVLTGAQTTDTTAATGGGDVIVSGGGPNPVFGDLNGDGLVDAIVGRADGTLGYFENTGTAAAPVFTERTGAANPFNGIDVGSASVPALADLDGDGDLDLTVGEFNGTLKYFENIGTATAPLFVERTGAANPFTGIDVGDAAAPAFVDLNGDGKLDLVVGSSDGTLVSFANTGSTAVPAFTPLVGPANPFNGIDAGNNSMPAFADANGDGIVDLLLGDASGAVTVYANTGTAAAPVYTLNPLLESPYAALDVGGAASQNIVLAGVGNDLVNQPLGPSTAGQTGVVSSGTDIVVGDNGYVSFDSTGLITGFGSSQTDVGGNDLINVGNGANIVVGGFGSDTVNSGAGADIILGDNGVVTYAAGTSNPLLVTSTDTTPATGGDDILNAGNGNNLIIGGVGADIITGGAGNNTIIGDNAQIQFTGPVMTNITATDTTAATGGNDIIVTGNGNNQIIAGVGSDTVTTGSGNNVVVGDNGTIINNPDGTLAQVSTGDPVLGGNDLITTGAGNDIVIGGAGADTILGGAGNDILIGDGGLVTITGGTITIGTKDPAYGGNDFINGGPGNDVIIGGAGTNTIIGSPGEDVIIGNNGVVTITGGIVTGTGMGGGGGGSGGGFLTEEELADILGDLFSGLPGHMAEGNDRLLKAIDRNDPLLDTAIFRRIFSLGTDIGRQLLIDADLFQKLFGSDALSSPEGLPHGDIMLEGEVPAPPGNPAPTTTGEARDTQTLAAGILLEADVEEEEGDASVAGDMLATAMGMSALAAVQKPRPAAAHAANAGAVWRRLIARLRP